MYANGTSNTITIQTYIAYTEKFKLEKHSTIGLRWSELRKSCVNVRKSCETHRTPLNQFDATIPEIRTTLVEDEPKVGNNSNLYFCVYSCAMDELT